MRHPIGSAIVGLVLTGTLLAGCGSSDGTDAGSATSIATETAATTTAAGGAVTSAPAATTDEVLDQEDPDDIVPGTLPSLGTLPPRPGARQCTLDGTISGAHSASFDGATGGSYDGYSGGREYAYLDGADSVSVLVVDEVDTNGVVTIDGVTYLAFGGTGITGELDGSSASIAAELTGTDASTIVVDVAFTC